VFKPIQDGKKLTKRMAPSHVATLLTFKQMIKKKTNAYKGKKVVKLPEQASQLHEDASANLSLSDYQCFSLNLN